MPFNTLEAHEKRIAALEQRESTIASLEEKVDRLLIREQRITEQLDDLLALRNKGAGVFWLATMLAGSGALSLIYWVFDLFKGHN